MGDHFSAAGDPPSLSERRRQREIEEYKSQKEINERLKKAEELLERTIRSGELSAGEWLSLVLEVVDFLYINNREV